MNKIIHLRVPQKTLTELDETRGEVPRSVLIRHAIDNFLYTTRPHVTASDLLKAATR